MNEVYARIGACVTAAVVASAAVDALAQSYPAKPIRLIVPFEPAGATDIVARAVADKLGAQLGQYIVVDNRSGAGGVIGADKLAKATPDGYTLGVATVSTIAAAPAMNPKSVPYHPTRDFSPISNLAATPNVLVVHPSFPPRDFRAFIARLKESPGKYSYASSGHGGLGHMLMTLFQSKTGTSLLHIPYRGGGPAMAALVGGHVNLMIANLPTALPHIEAGRLVAIAIASDESVARRLKIPTFSDVGLAEVNRVAFYGLAGPRGLPQAIVHRLHDATMQALNDPRVRERIESTGSVVIGNSPAEFAREIRTELEIYRRIVPTLKPEG